MSQSNMAASSNGTNEDNQIGVSGNTLPVSSNIIWVFFCFLKPFAIEPKYDCPHLGEQAYIILQSAQSNDAQQPPCGVCTETEENWICLHENCSYVGHLFMVAIHSFLFILCLF